MIVTVKDLSFWVFKHNPILANATCTQTERRKVQYYPKVAIAFWAF